MKNVLVSYRDIAAVPDARRLLAADAISKAGDWILYVAMSILVYQAGGAGSLALFSALRIGIPFVLGPWAGRWGAAYSARSVMIFADVVRAVLLVLAAGVAWAGISVWALQVLVVGCAALTALHAPAERRFQRDTISEEQRASFNAVLGATGSAVMVIAPATGGLMTVAVGNIGALVADGASFLLSALLILRVKPTPITNPAPVAVTPNGDTAGRSQGALQIALRACRANPYVLAAVITQGVACTVAGACLVLLPVLDDRLGSGDGVVGWLTAALGIGSVIGTLLGGVVARGGRRILATSSIVALGLVLGLMGSSSHLFVALIGAALAGITANIPEPLYWTTYAGLVDEEDSSAFYGLVESTITGGFALGGLILGSLVTGIGTEAAAWWIGASGSLLAAIAYVHVLRGRRRSVTESAQVSP